jgi:signal transduction histidine kinase
LTVPFAWRRSHPVAVPVTVYTAGAVEALFHSGDLPIGFVIAALLAAYSVAAHASLRAALVVLGYGLASLELATLLTSPEGLASALLTAPIFTVLPWGVGRLVARLSGQRRTLESLNLRLEHEREEMARTSVLEERSRIARELHDIVAHSISVMVIQAGAAEQFVVHDEGVREPLEAIRTTGQQALTEMRRLLGILRTDDAAALSLAPQPGLASLDTLVEQARRGGLDVTVTVEGEPVPLPPGMDVAAYRLVQESFSNVRRHARATSASVALRFARGCLAIDVLDDGVGGPVPVHGSAGPAGAGGHGLIGMRERVSLYGGQLDAGPRAEGGWRVRAELPLAG